MVTILHFLKVIVFFFNHKLIEYDFILPNSNYCTNVIVLQFGDLNAVSPSNLDKGKN
jgi:hypothetical protein